MSVPAQAPDRARARGWALVAAQVVLLGILVLAPAGHSWPRPAALRTLGSVLRSAGAVAIVAGAVALGRSLRVHPEPPASAVLRTGGAYRLVRHPIYSGVLALAAGIAVSSGNPVKAAAAVALAGVFHAKASLEEGLLRSRFPGYAAYAARTGRFVPRLRPGGSH